MGIKTTMPKVTKIILADKIVFDDFQIHLLVSLCVFFFSWKIQAFQ